MFLLIWFICGWFFAVQTSSVVGTVVEHTSNTLTIKTDQNVSVRLEPTDKAIFLRIPAGARSLEHAAPIALEDIAPGDRVLARGTHAGNGFAAVRIVVLAKADIAGSFRTIGATLTAIDLAKGEISATTLDLKKPIQISVLKETSVRRIPAALVPALAQKARANSQAEVQQMIESLPVVPLTDLKAGDVVSITGIREKDDTRFTAIKLVAGVDAVLRAMAPQPGRPQTVRLSAGLPSAFDFSVIP